MTIEQTVTVTRRKLTRMYDRYAREVLDGYFEEDDTDEKVLIVIKELPPAEVYQKMRDEHFTDTVANLVARASQKFQELADELRDWYENLPENFQMGEKAMRLEEAADALEQLEMPDVPESVANLAVLFLPERRSSSRSGRRDEATSILEHVQGAVRESQGENDGEVIDEKTELGSFLGELEGAILHAGNVEFPGMY